VHEVHGVQPVFVIPIGFLGRRRNINLILDHGVGAPAGAEGRRNINLI